MATNNKYSRTYFIVGLLLGLLLGLYVSLKFIQRNNEIKYMPISIQSVTDTTEKIIIKKRKKKPTKKAVVKVKNNIKNNVKNKFTKTDSLVNDSITLDSNDLLTESDSLLNINDSINSKASFSKPDSIVKESKDSLIYKVLNIEQQNNDGDIQIAKNELIYAIFVKPQGNRSDFLCSSNYNSKRDSLLINNLKYTEDDGLYVEFWRSPINYTGYKLSHNTLVLFGIYQYTSIRLKYLKNGVLELEYLDNKFKLKCSEDFSPINLKSNL